MLAVLPAPATGSNVATVTITLTGMIWFVDASASAGGDGTLTAPFDALADHNGNALDQDGQCLFLASGSYGGGLTLQAGQIVVGQGAGASLASICGVTLPPGSRPLPATGGARPVITNTGGNGISVAAGNTIRGLDIGDTAAASDGIAGGSVGALRVSEVAITGAGGGVDLANGTLEVALDTLSSTGSDNGIRLAGTGGSFVVGGDGATTQHAQPVSGDLVTLLARNGSGGSISGTSGHGVALSNASGVALRQMMIGGTAGDGINLINCADVVVSAADIGNTTGSAYEASELRGTCRIDNGSRLHDFNGSQTHAVNVRNTNENLVLLQISDTLFENQANTNGAACIDFDSLTNAEMAIAIDDCEFRNLFGSALVIAAGQSGGTVTGRTVANVRNNLIHGAATATGFMSAEFAASGESDLIYNYTGNVVDDAARGSGASWHTSGLAQGAARLNATVSNNTLRNIANRGAIAFRSVQNQAASAKNHVIDGLIDGNTIDGVGRESVYVRAFNQTSDMDVKVSNNAIGQNVAVGFASFNGGNFTTIDSNHRDSGDLDIHIDSNVITANAGLPGGALNFLGTVSVWTDTPAANNSVHATVTNNSITNAGTSPLALHMDQFTPTTRMNAEVHGNNVDGLLQLWEENEGQFLLRDLAGLSARNGGAATSFPGTAAAPTTTGSLPNLPTFNFPNP